MARHFAASTARIQNTSFPATATTGSVGCWIKPSWNSGDGAIHVFWTFANDNTTDPPSFQKFSDNKIYCGFAGGGHGEQRVIINDTGLFVSGTWAYWLFTWSNSGAGSTSLYKNNTLVGSTATLTPISQQSVTVGNYRVNTSNQNAAADIAEFAYWSGVALGTTDLASLVSGVRAANVQYASLAGFWPLLGVESPEPDVVDGYPLSIISGTSQATHPPLTADWDWQSRGRAYLLPEPGPPARQLAPALSFLLTGGVSSNPSDWLPSMILRQPAPQPPAAPPRPAPSPAWLFSVGVAPSPSDWLPAFARRPQAAPAAPRPGPFPAAPTAFLLAPGVVPRPPGGLERNKGRPGLNRVPVILGEDPKVSFGRLSRAMDNLSALWNSLVRNGQLRQLASDASPTGADNYAIRGAAHVDTRPPGAFDDSDADCFVSMFWVNSATKKAYICVSASPGAAQWDAIN